MKKTAKSLLLVCLLILLLVFSGYFLLALYYREGFSLNTWINGVYCTGKTVEEVNAELLSGTEAPIVIITGKNGESFPLDLAKAEYKEDFRQPLNEFMEKQNPLLWVDNILFSQDYELTPNISYNEEALRSLFGEIEFVKAEQQMRTDYELVYNSENGFVLYDGLNDRLDVDKAFQALQESISTGVTTLDLNEAACYYSIPLTTEQEAVRKLAKQVEAFQNCNIVYDMGDERIPLDAAIMSTFLKKDRDKIVRDENGELLLDEDAVSAFVADLAKDYDTYRKEREFQSTRGDIITIKGGIYGTLIDQDAEVKYLMENLMLEEAHTDILQYHIPAYEKEGVVRGKNDIGDTYIEVDMTEQKMYYYKNGELMVETDVVTGNTSRRWGTPEGVNYVYAKQKNRILRGEGYASPVKFWMPVNGNIGIHDASWRSEFGGDIYETNGSHGCINTPTEKMTELYEMVEIGTPVILFY